MRCGGGNDEDGTAATTTTTPPTATTTKHRSTTTIRGSRRVKSFIIAYCLEQLEKKNKNKKSKKDRTLWEARTTLGRTRRAARARDFA